MTLVVKTLVVKTVVVKTVVVKTVVVKTVVVRTRENCQGRCQVSPPPLPLFIYTCVCVRVYAWKGPGLRVLREVCCKTDGVREG